MGTDGKQTGFFLTQFINQIKKKPMKKFLTDNMHWIVLIALVLAGFAVWKITKGNKNEKLITKPETATE